MARIGERRRRHQHQFGTERANRRHFLAALIVGHDDDRLIPERVTDEREPDPGIARGPFDDRSARFQTAVRLGIANNIERGAILYRSAGVGIFALAPDFAARGFAGPAQQYQGCVANQG